jgi:predicted GNAT family N-acyltransferase
MLDLNAMLRGGLAIVAGVSNRFAGMRIEHASGSDFALDELERFRYRIYIEELGKSLPTADRARRRLGDPDDASAFHFIARAGNGDIVGCVRLHMAPDLPEDCIGRLGIARFAAEHDRAFGYVSKLMVQRDLRGLGIAQDLMLHMVRFGHSAPFFGEIAFFHCHPRLVPTYERVGFRRFGRPFLDTHVGRQVPMHIVGGDVEHFERCRSSLASTAREFRIDEKRKARLSALIPALAEDLENV